MPGLGWLGVEHERHEFLHRQSLLMRTIPRVEDIEIPKVIDHRPWRRVENQGQMGSCVGNSGGSGCEITNYIDTRGEVLQLSRMYCYLQSQRKSGISGDNGATISGCIEAITDTNVGICREDVFPYPSRYSTSIPPEAIAEGKNHSVKSHQVLRTYAEVFQWLATGTGVVQIGIPWLESLANSNGVVDDLGGQTYGGHALILWGYSERKDSKGNQYIWLENSHGSQWGNGGYAEIAPEIVSRWAGSNDCEVIGFSDIEEFSEPKSRIYDWTGSDFMS